MFGRIFPISVGVRAHFASGPHALSRVAAREKFLCTAPSFFARFMNNTSESGLLAPLSFLLSIAGARTQILGDTSPDQGEASSRGKGPEPLASDAHVVGTLSDA